MTRDAAQEPLHERTRIEGSWATPGPWRFYDTERRAVGEQPGWVQSTWQRDDEGQSPGGDVVCDVFDRRDAHLIALAPEMAEAILKVVEDDGVTHYEGIAACRRIAQKLRTIGGDHA